MLTVRQVDHSNRSVSEINKSDHFDFFQAEQNSIKKPFHKCDVIISFISTYNFLWFTSTLETDRL